MIIIVANKFLSNFSSIIFSGNSLEAFLYNRKYLPARHVQMEYGKKKSYLIRLEFKRSQKKKKLRRKNLEGIRLK